MSEAIPQVESPFGFILTEKQEELLTGYKVDQIRENYRYLTKHPEIKKFINLLLKAVLFEQPHKVRQFLYDYIQDNFSEIKSILEPEIMSTETGDPRQSMMMINKWRNKYKYKHSFKVPNCLSVENSQKSVSTASNIPTISKIIGDFGFYENLLKNLPEEKLIKMKIKSKRNRSDQTRPRFLSDPKSIIDTIKPVCPLPQETITYTTKQSQRELSMFSQNTDGRTPSELCFSRISGIAVKKNIPDFGFYGDQIKRKAEEKRLQDEYCMLQRSTRETF